MIRFKTTIKVRYYECDPMGVVHHSNYIRYFECARNEMTLGFLSSETGRPTRFPERLLAIMQAAQEE